MGRCFSVTEQILVPTLERGETVIMDNLPVHKVAGVREAIEAAVRMCFICRHIRPT
jgi:hypothetical protein